MRNALVQAYRWMGVLLVSLTLVGCGGPPPGTLAMVNNRPITGTDLTTAVGVTEILEGVTLPMDPVHRRAYVQQLVNNALVLQWAEQHHTHPRPASTLDTLLGQSRLYLGSPQNLQKQLALHSVSITAFRQFVAQQQTLAAVFAGQTQAVPQPSGSAVRAYYLGHPQEFRQPSRVLVREILVKTNAQAQGILRQLHQGASFSSLARRDSQDKASAKQGGSLGYVATGPASELPPGVYHVMDQLHPLQFGIAKTRFGYHILEVQAVQSGKLATLAVVTPAIKDQLWVEAKNRVFEGFVNRLRAHAKIALYLKS